MKQTNFSHKIPRVKPTDMYPRVGDATEKLKAIIPVFGKNLVSTLIKALKTEQIKSATLRLTNTDPSQKLEAIFENKTGSKNLEVDLKGDWKKIANIPQGNPLFAPVRGIIYRKRKSNDTLPIAVEGKTIEPGGPICIISQTKNNMWYLYLPAEDFPRGGILRKFLIADGNEVEKDAILCYVQKVE